MIKKLNELTKIVRLAAMLRVLRHPKPLYLLSNESVHTKRYFI